MDATLDHDPPPDVAQHRASRESLLRSEGGGNTFSLPRPRCTPNAGKRAADLVLATALLVLLLPAMGLIAALLRTTCGPRILIRHVRIGRDGVPFACLKFRSMVHDADRVLGEYLAKDAAARTEWRDKGKLQNDPRITPLGRLLRRSSLDELPQLFNVLRGEMSLVGPRPVTETELQAFFPPDAVALYCSVRPGLTGLWQISGRSRLGYADRIRLDGEYVRNASLMLDALILLRTPLAVLTGRGAC